MTAVAGAFEVRDRLAGRLLPEGGRSREYVCVDLDLRWLGRRLSTVEHLEVPGGWEFAASGMVVARRNSLDCHRAGQCLDVLGEAGFTAVPPWSAEDVGSLLAIWRRWHLNAMHAGCVHVPEPVYEDVPYRRPDLKRTPECPVTGYRYGHAWLFEPIPEEVLAEIVRLGELAARSPVWELGRGVVAGG